MADVEEVHFKGANLHAFTRVDSDQARFFVEAAPIQLGLDEAEGERGGIDRRVHGFEQVANGAGMVFVAMGDNNPHHLVGALLDVFKIGDDVVNPDHIVIGEHHTGVHDEDFVIVFVDGHVLADFTQPSQGDDS